MGDKVMKFYSYNRTVRDYLRYYLLIMLRNVRRANRYIMRNYIPARITMNVDVSVCIQRCRTTTRRIRVRGRKKLISVAVVSTAEISASV